MELRENVNPATNEQVEIDASVNNSENSKDNEPEVFDPEKAKRRQNLARFTRFLDDDLAVKKIMFQIAPSEMDEYDKNSLVDYSDKLHHGLKDATFYLSRMMDMADAIDTKHEKDFHSTFEPLRNRLSEIENDAINTKIDNDQLQNFYQSHVSNIHPDFVKKVTHDVYAHSIDRKKNTNTIGESASSINEILHLVHSYVMRNEDVMESLPVLSKDPNTNNGLYGDEDANNPIAKEIYDGLGKQAEESDVVALKDRTLLIIRDYGHATMVDITENPDGGYDVEYSIPKICSPDKANSLPGVHKVKTQYDSTSGDFQIKNASDCAKIILDFISRIPTDNDIKPSHNESINQ